MPAAPSIAAAPLPWFQALLSWDVERYRTLQERGSPPAEAIEAWTQGFMRRMTRAVVGAWGDRVVAPAHVRQGPSDPQARQKAANEVAAVIGEADALLVPLVGGGVLSGTAARLTQQWSRMRQVVQSTLQAPLLSPDAPALPGEDFTDAMNAVLPATPPEDLLSAIRTAEVSPPENEGSLTQDPPAVNGHRLSALLDRKRQPPAAAVVPAAAARTSPRTKV